MIMARKKTSLNK